MEEAGDVTESVSYTHLMQALPQTIHLEMDEQKTKQLKAMLGICQGPVSYTHLDVYKRQSLSAGRVFAQSGYAAAQ